MTEKKIDRYVFNTKNLIGSGSFGEVFRATDENTQKQVALKMINKNKVAKDAYAQQGLISEIKIMEKLTSPNVVRLLDVLETANNYYIIQELCEGGDLSIQLKKESFMTEMKAVKLVTDILRGFTELIQLGVIHRDLKPANILIHNGSYKIADFGFSKTVDNYAKQMFFSSVGTPLYMSPQILQNTRYSTKSDIWSLGFIFYEALYGKTPWTANCINQLIENIQKKPLIFDDKKNQVSEKTKDVIRRCLVADEAKRISWQELYKHPVFCNEFQEFLNQDYELENKAKFIVNSIRDIVNQQQIELEQLFSELVQQKTLTLTLQTFGQFICRIDPDLSRIEIEHIFNKIDVDNSNSIDLNEFKQWLTKNDVTLSFREPQNQQQIVHQKTQEVGQLRASQALSQQVYLTIQKIKLAIQKYNINLMELFKKYNKSQDGLLKISEFGTMLKRIDQSLNEGQITQAFDYFDIDKQGSINYEDFIAIIETIDVSGFK